MLDMLITQDQPRELRQGEEITTPEAEAGSANAPLRRWKFSICWESDLASRYPRCRPPRAGYEAMGVDRGSQCGSMLRKLSERGQKRLPCAARVRIEFKLETPRRQDAKTPRIRHKARPLLIALVSCVMAPCGSNN